jgi:hypothetical protein
MTRKDFFTVAAQHDLRLAQITAALYPHITPAVIEMWTLQHAANLRQQAQQQLKGEAA